MVSSPNLALLHDELVSVRPVLWSPINSHDLVVCSFLALFKNTDITSGFSELGSKVRYQINAHEPQIKPPIKIEKKKHSLLLTSYLSSFRIIKCCSKAIDMSCIRVDDCFLCLFFSVVCLQVQAWKVHYI